MTLKIDPTTQSTNVGSTELNNFDDLVQWIHKIFQVRIQSFIEAEYAGHHYDHWLQEFQKIHHGGDSIWDAVSCLFPKGKAFDQARVAFNQCTYLFGEPLVLFLKNSWTRAKQSLPTFLIPSSDDAQLRSSWMVTDWNKTIRSFVLMHPDCLRFNHCQEAAFRCLLHVHSIDAVFLKSIQKEAKSCVSVPLLDFRKITESEEYQLHEEFSKEFRRIVEFPGNEIFVPMATVGDGSCALHAAFGSLRSEGFFCEHARELAAIVLDAVFKGKNNRHAPLEHLESVIASLWSELVLPAAKNKLNLAAPPPPEALQLWSAMGIELQQICSEHIQLCLMKQREDKIFLSRFDDLVRDLCIDEHDFLLRKLGSDLQHLPNVDGFCCSSVFDIAQIVRHHKDSYDFLQSVAFLKGKTGHWIVKGTRDVACPDDAVNKLSKYEALFDKRPCFDSIRRSFFLPSEKVRLQVVNSLERIAISLNKAHVVAPVCQHLRSRDRHVTNGSVGSIDAPENFDTLVWPAYQACLKREGHNYYFSCDELLAIADGVGSNVIIVACEGNDAKVIGCSCRHSGETAFVFWNGAARGHFERALPLKVILEGVFPEKNFLALSEFSRSLTHSLGCTPLNWPSLGTSRSPILCLHAIIDMYDKWTSFLQNEWTQMLSALPNYVKDDLRTLHRKWLSERHKTLLSLFLGKNVIDEHNRGFERSVRFRSK